MASGDKKGKNSKGSKEAKSPPKTREQKQAEKRALALWALLGTGGSGFGGLMRPIVDKAEREALAEAGLITFEKRKGGAFWLDVTDRGWRWAEEHLSHPLPDRTQGGAFVLRAWLARLQAFMQARNIGLAEVLGPQAAARCERSAGETTARDDDDRPALRERIRKAYLDVTGGSFNKRALLSEVRARLEDVHRLDLDEALKHMQQNDEASLMQLDNSVEITEADRTAALYIGREPRHILWILR